MEVTSLDPPHSPITQLPMALVATGSCVGAYRELNSRLYVCLKHLSFLGVAASRGTTGSQLRAGLSLTHGTSDRRSSYQGIPELPGSEGPCRWHHQRSTSGSLAGSEPTTSH